MIHNLITQRMMFPEPEDTGSGAAPETETTNAVSANESVTEQPNAEDENPFSIAFSTEESDTEESENDAEETDDYSLNITSDDGFDDDEVTMLTGLCKKYNLPSEAVSSFLKDVYAEADKRNKAEEKSSFDNATKQLQDKWGDGFHQNAKKAGAMIRQMGGRLGWDEDRMKSMLNPHDIELMYEMARYMGNSTTRGLQNAAPVAKVEMTLDQIEERRKALILENLLARQRGDVEAMTRTSDEHFELSKKLKGDKAVALLPRGVSRR